MAKPSQEGKAWSIRLRIKGQDMRVNCGLRTQDSSKTRRRNPSIRTLNIGKGKLLSAARPHTLFVDELMKYARPATLDDFKESLGEISICTRLLEREEQCVSNASLHRKDSMPSIEQNQEKCRLRLETVSA